MQRKVSVALAGLCLLLSSIVLLGWAFNIPELIDLFPHHAIMKFNTALSIFLLGLALVSFQYSGKYFGRKSTRLIVLTVSSVVVLLTFATLVEYVADLNFNIDELAVRDLSQTSSPPGRMSIITAVILFLSGLALVIRLISVNVVLWQSLVMLNLFMLCIAILGYAYSASTLAAIYPYTSIAIPTVVALVMISLSALLSLPEVGILAVLNSVRTGGRIARKLLPRAIATLVMLGFINRLGNYSHLFDASFGSVFIVSCGVAIISWLVWQKAQILNAFDEERERNLISLKRSRDEERATADSLKLLIDHSPGAVAMLDKDMKYVWASNRWLVDFRLEGRTLTGRSHYEIFREIPEHWKAIHRRCLAGAVEKNDEEQFVRADGGVNWIRWETRPWIASTGEIGGIVIFSEDITEKRIAQDKLKKLNQELEQKVLARTVELQESEQRYRQVIELAGDGIFESDLGARCISVNQAGCQMLGYTRDELIGKQSIDMVSEEDTQRFPAAFAQHLSSDVALVSEWQLKHKDGHLVPVEINANAMPGQRVIAFVRDITERKRAEAELAASERRYRTLVDGAYDSILVCDASGRIILANRHLSKKFGYSVDEVIGQPIEILMPQRFRAKHVMDSRIYIRNAHPRPMGASGELYGRRKDGSEFPVDISLSPTTSSEGVQITAIIRDITERKRHEDQHTFLSLIAKTLDETMSHQERLQRIADSMVPQMADCCVVRILEDDELACKALATRDNIQSAVLEAAIINGLDTKDPICARSVADTREAILIEDLRADVACNRSIDPAVIELVANAGIRSVLIVPLIASGRAIGVLSLFMTSSERKFNSDDFTFMQDAANRCAVAVENARLYAEAKHAVSAREGILAIVSHDLKNPVSSIEMSMELLLADDLTKEQTRAIAGGVKSSSAIMQRLISDLLDFGKIEAGTFSVEQLPIEVHAIIDLALEAMRKSASDRNTKLVVDVGPGVSRLYCDRHRVVQVLWNLLGNAIKFSPIGGTVSLTLELNDKFVEFTVADSGPGIEAQNLNKVFDRFWQAKNTAHLGTGLGLAIAKGIVEAHGGRIWVESDFVHGSRFHFTVPAIQENDKSVREATADRTVRAALCSAGQALRGVHVLAVDDSPENLQLVRIFLERAGAQVTTAGSVGEALPRIEREKPDVIITDIEMPEASGFDLFERVNQIATRGGHHIPTVALSAHISPAEIAKIARAGFDAQLAKPLTMEGLVTTLQKLVRPETLH